MYDLKKPIYDDFYVAYFDSAGNVIYPTDIEEAQTIRKMLKNVSSNSLILIEGKNLCYKVRIKRKIVNGMKVQVVELSNVTEFINQLSKASIDEITHLNNRKMARQEFMNYIEQAYNSEEDFCILLADLDKFKNVNDTYGHTNGDIVLGEVSRILFCSTRQEQGREKDIVARLGGDEFVIIFKNISEKYSEKKAEFIRNEVQNHRVQLFGEGYVEEYISAGTLSIGLYHVTCEELKELYKKGYNTDEIRTLLLDRCDTALYSSKNNGKNQVTSYSKGKKLELKI